MTPVKSHGDRLLPIREVAAILDVSIDLLRKWDRMGDDAPLRSAKRTGGGWRLYSESEVEALREKRSAGAA